MIVMGTRPEAIKLAPVIQALRSRPADFEVFVCSTGQHREMLDQTLAAFDLTPDADLSVMRHDQTLPELTALLITQVTQKISEVKPDWVIVQGDTSTAFASALAAYYQRVPVAHVEAGLRSHDRHNPFPEEINRQLIGALADLHFAPTSRAADALRREGIDPQRIFVTGNTVVDALLQLKARLQDADGARRISEPVKRLTSGGETIVLVTCHRRESFGPSLTAICRAIARLAADHPQVSFIFPVHLNPNVRSQVLPLLGQVGNIHLLEPLGYEDFVFVLARATLALSDSGGIQEEAPSFGVPVLVLRSTTERTEGIEAGVAELVGADEDLIVRRATAILNARDGAGLPQRLNPYGDGQAAARIADILTRTSIEKHTGS